jgi:hypothetical protein
MIFMCTPSTAKIVDTLLYSFELCRIIVNCFVFAWISSTEKTKRQNIRILTPLASRVVRFKKRNSFFSQILEREKKN